MNISKNLVDNNCIFSLEGDIKHPESTPFHQILVVFSEENIDQVTIDFSQVEFIDSSGLGILFLAADKAKETGKKIVLKNPLSNIRKIFEISHINNLESVQID